MVTREDVAKRAGVSVSAVSRTMNGRGYTMFLFTSFDVVRCRTMLMDGMIVENDTVALKVQEKLGDSFFLPVVSASYGLPIVKTKRIPYVDVDTYDAVEIAIHYLRKNGHHKIAFAGPYNYTKKEVVHPRYAAYENNMRQVLLKQYERFVIEKEQTETFDQFEKSNFYEEGMQGADEFVRRNINATAMICFNDEFALGMMRRLQDLNYKIPEELSIVWIDGIRKRKQANPPLTSVGINIKKQAGLCVDVLIEGIEGRRQNLFTSIKPVMLEGGTVRKVK